MGFWMNGIVNRGFWMTHSLFVVGVLDLLTYICPNLLKVIFMSSFHFV